MSPKQKCHSTVLVKLKNVRYNCSDYIFTQSYIPYQNVFLLINITFKLISVNKEKNNDIPPELSYKSAKNSITH